MPVARVIPEAWLVPARPKRVICHWTAGAYAVSELDREHYHVILEDLAALKRGKDVRAHRGDHTIADNDRTGDGDYAAHTRGCNTGSIGLSVACMAGSARGAGGPYPLTLLLWERLAQAAAECCKHYGIPVTEQTVLQHGEVERLLGIPQAGKWDVTWLPFEPHLSALEVGAQFRRKVDYYLKNYSGARG